MQRISLTPRPAPTAIVTRAQRPPAGVDLGWALRTVLRAYLAESEATLAEAPGGQHGYEILAAVGDGEFGTQIELAHRLGIHRTVVTDRIDDLERAGLLERRLWPADRRVRRLVITDAGRAVLDRLSRRLSRAEAAVLDNFDGEAERAEFVRLLRDLAWRTGGMAVAG